MFTRHRLSPANKLDCPHAIGTNAFSPQRAESCRHILLLPAPHSTPSLRSVAQDRLHLFTTDTSRRIFESALERVRRNNRSLHFTDHRFAMIYSGRDDRVGNLNCPTQAKRRLEWAPPVSSPAEPVNHSYFRHAARPRFPLYDSSRGFGRAGCIMFSGKIVGILGLIAQCAAVCFWTWEAADAAWLAFTNPEHKQLVGASILLISVSAALAAGTAYCIYRQFKWAEENRRFTAWLVANAEKIRNNNPAFFRSQRITLDTELVRHHLVFSALIVSCRMQTQWIIKGQEPRFWNAVAANLYTLFSGWWCFPFGAFWTPVAPLNNRLASSCVRLSDLLQPAPPKPIGFSQRFE